MPVIEWEYVSNGYKPTTDGLKLVTLMEETGRGDYYYWTSVLTWKRKKFVIEFEDGDMPSPFEVFAWAELPRCAVPL